MSRSGVIQASIGAIAGIGVCVWLHFGVFSKPILKSEANEMINEIQTKSSVSILKMTSDQLNRTCPKMLDTETRLDSTAVVSTSVFGYYFTLISQDASSFDKVGMSERFESGLIEQLKSNPGMEYFRTNKVTLVYEYRDKNGQVLMTLNLTPDKYSN